MPRVGKYHIARKIADGGMAEIFLGTQHGMEGFERPVVLKRILAPLVADPQFRNMLIDEAHVAMGLNHSNIVQVLDLGHVRGRYFLVMELVDGWDLSQIIARAAAAAFPLPPELSLYVAAEVCRALAYAHARVRDGQPLAIVHRDVSPQNVLVSEQGEVKLTDFGIAKAMGRREHTGQGVIKGKLAFMSPEQASGAILDGRSDLFSLATMLYLLFTGRRPFEAPTDLESILRVRQCQFTPPEVVSPSLDPALVKILHRAMQALPADRFQSAEEMLLDIENVQRTAYRPAGQTELKRWLADLEQRDHCPNISRQAAAPTQPVAAATEELDIGEGAEVIFDESSVLAFSDAAAARETQPTVATVAESVVIVRTHSEDVTSATTPVTKTKGKLPTRVLVFVSMVVSLAFGMWLLLPSRHPTRPRNVKETRTTQADVSTQVPGTATTPSPPTLPRPVLVAAGPDASTEPRIDAGDAGVTSSPADKKSGISPIAENDEEEEILLKHAEPEDGDRVLDADEGVPPHAKSRAGKVSAPLAEPVSVRVESNPQGAVVSLGKRVFGRAPINLRFRPGITFELKFVKKGYLPKTKHFAVTAGQKKQTIRVGLKKRSEPKKSLFRRIFG